MTLVSMTEMLQKAKNEGYAVGQFNINNLEFTQAILQAAEEEKSPVICGLSMGATRYMGGFRAAVTLVESLMAEYGVTVPVAIHLDHGPGFEKCMEAIHAGVPSVMIDGSSLPLDENIALTRRVVEAAHAVGVSVEGELGRVGAQDSGEITNPEDYHAIPSECGRFVEETEVDCFAPALGSIHGPYKGGGPDLNFERMKEVSALTDHPLVLHGGTGIPKDDIDTAIAYGTAKININSENQIAASKKVRETLTEQPELYDPRKFLAPAREAIKETVQEKMRLFSSSGRA